MYRVRLTHGYSWKFHINSWNATLLRLVYKNETFLSFVYLSKRDKSVSIHQKNLQILATEICKTKNDVGPKILKDTFCFIQKPYNLRNDPELQRRRNRTVYCNRTVQCNRKHIFELSIHFYFFFFLWR